MRPRVFPAEDSERLCVALKVTHGFNEAAGIPRGRRPEIRDKILKYIEASMRPRVFPAEDAGVLAVGSAMSQSLQ